MSSKFQHFGAAARLLWSVSPIVDIGRDGWPVKLHEQAIAALQSWRDGDGEETPERKERQFDWVQAIRGACTHSKTLPHERRVLAQNPLVMGGDVVGVVTDYAYYITAQDFSEWLAVHGEAPSPLVQLWFKARGVGCAPAGESIEERNARWLLKWDAECPTHSSGSQARAIAAIVAAEGVTPATAKRGLQDANKARAESYRAGGVHPIKQGKNTANDPFNTVKKRSSKSR